MNKLVSVIIPNYNSSLYIEDTINSVLNQSYENIEIIVVDDFSTDDSVELVSKISQNHKNIKIIKLESNFGRPAGPRNIGLDCAQGDFIAFLDSDDIWHHQKIEIQLKKMKEEDSAFSSTDIEHFKNKESLKNFDKIYDTNKIFVKKRKLNDLLIKNFIISGSSVLCKREIIKDTKFNEDELYKAVEDYQFWLDLHKDENFESIFIPEKLVYYRHSESSISKDKLNQAKKVYNLLNNYRNNGLGLGFKKYLYFTTYIFLSIKSLLIRKVRKI